jgi:ABC-type nitrate/sulfonate/bicarbonate transport system permease component
MSNMHRWTVRAGRVLTIAAVALAWELAGRLEWVDPDLLPPLSKVLAVLWRLLHDDAFLADIRATALECLVAFAIVAPLGLAFGFLIGESRRLERMLGPALQILLTIPKSIFLPVFVLMLGIGFAQKVVFAVAIAFFIVVPTGIAAVHSVPRALVTAVHSFGATRGQIYTRVYLPAMAPLILGGIRLGLIFTVHGVIFAEMYGSTEGIGRSILLWGEQFQMDYLFAAVLLVVVVTIALNELMQLGESYSRARFNAEAAT